MTQITQGVSLGLIGLALITVGLSLQSRSRNGSPFGVIAIADWMGLMLAVVLVGLPAASWQCGALSFPAMSGTSGSAGDAVGLVAWRFGLSPLRSWMLVLIQLGAVRGIQDSRHVRGGAIDERRAAGDTAVRTARLFAILFAVTTSPEHALALLLSLLVSIAASATMRGGPAQGSGGGSFVPSFWNRCVLQTVILGIPTIWLRQFWAGAAETDSESWDLAMQTSALLTILMVTPLLPLFPWGAWLIVDQRDRCGATWMWSGCVLPVAFILVVDGVLSVVGAARAVSSVFLGWTGLTCAVAVLIQWSHPLRAVRSRARMVLTVASVFGLLAARQAAVEAIAMLLVLPWMLMMSDSDRTEDRAGWRERSSGFIVCGTLFVESFAWLGLYVPAGPYLPVGHSVIDAPPDGILALTFLVMNLAGITAYARDTDWLRGGRGLHQQIPTDSIRLNQDRGDGWQQVAPTAPGWLPGLVLLLLFVLGLQNYEGIGRLCGNVYRMDSDRIAMLLGVLLSPLVIAFSIRKLRATPGYLALPESNAAGSLANLLADPGQLSRGDLVVAFRQAASLFSELSRVLMRQIRHGLTQVLSGIRSLCLGAMDNDVDEQLGLVIVLALLVLSFLLVGAG